MGNMGIYKGTMGTYWGIFLLELYWERAGNMCFELLRKAQRFLPQILWIQWHIHDISTTYWYLPHIPKSIIHILLLNDHENKIPLPWKVKSHNLGSGEVMIKCTRPRNFPFRAWSPEGISSMGCRECLLFFSGGLAGLSRENPLHLPAFSSEKKARTCEASLRLSCQAPSNMEISQSSGTTDPSIHPSIHPSVHRYVSLVISTNHHAEIMEIKC